MSTISWLRDEHGRPGRTWNPIRARHRVTGKVGWHCEPVHEGCRHCYAAAQNRAGARGGTRLDYKPGHRGDVELFLDERVLMQPLRWRKPLRIFPCSMTDLYGAWVQDEWIDRIKAVQALTPQHTYIELTKRPERMREYLSSGCPAPVLDMGSLGRPDVEPLAEPGARIRIAHKLQRMVPVTEWNRGNVAWPLLNVWAGPSCSTQADADWMIPEVLRTPLAKRIVSLEPLLGEIALRNIEIIPHRTRAGVHVDALSGSCVESGLPFRSDWNPDGEAPYPDGPGPKLDLVIVGGLNGPAPTELQHIHSVVMQCRAAGVPCFVKQLGRSCRMNRTDAVQAVALGAGWQADGKDAALGVVSFRNRKGEDPREWPEDLRIREWPRVRP